MSAQGAAPGRFRGTQERRDQKGNDSNSSTLARVEARRLVVTLAAGQYAPRELRQTFSAALRESIMRATLDGRIENYVAEELWRVIPAPERA